MACLALMRASSRRAAPSTLPNNRSKPSLPPYQLHPASHAGPPRRALLGTTPQDHVVE
ncbi:hypothetical protein EYF80_031434 [Liparis tanakae]|uniref:Uncharacterized protein n=1 Tax=Liparis tanakae TaxID=230148 RepID=A0A4Z2H0B1_9TELE|nr:hypothetical protein EYF80_031434 [Liparis tanakae]